MTLQKGYRFCKNCKKIKLIESDFTKRRNGYLTRYCDECWTIIYEERCKKVLEKKI